MDALLDVEIGFPVAAPIPGDGRVSPGLLPAGRYASLVYTGIANGMAANRALLEWGAREGLKWDRWRAENGDAFGARVEHFLTGGPQVPDTTTWQTEVAIKLADMRACPA